MTVDRVHVNGKCRIGRIYQRLKPTIKVVKLVRQTHYVHKRHMLSTPALMMTPMTPPPSTVTSNTGYTEVEDGGGKAGMSSQYHDSAQTRQYILSRGSHILLCKIHTKYSETKVTEIIKF